MRLDIAHPQSRRHLPQALRAGRYPQRNDHFVQATGPSLALGYQLWFKTAITVSGSIQIDRASLSLEGFACAAVPRIAATPTSGIAFLISHMIAHLGLQTTLEDAADQLGQKPALARQRDPVGASLIDKLINVFIADQRPPHLTCRRRRARI